MSGGPDNQRGLLLKLINSILDLAKIESGRLQIDRAEFDLVEIIESVSATLGMKAYGKGLKLVVRIAPNVPTRVIGDPPALVVGSGEPH